MMDKAINSEEIPATSPMMRVDWLPICGLKPPKLKFVFSVVEETFVEGIFVKV